MFNRNSRIVFVVSNWVCKPSNSCLCDVLVEDGEQFVHMEEMNQEFRFLPAVLHSSSFPFQTANVFVNPGAGVI